ncbi:hypothetical protein D3C72_1010030 [compost metagenome]
MPRVWMLALTLLMVSTGAPAFGQAGHGPGHPAPITVQMTPRMINGEGSVMFHPMGDRVDIHIVANRLPPPATYSLWLVDPKSGGPAAREIAALPATDGKAELRLTIPAAELRKWRTIELIHQPSGSLHNTEHAHPALQATIPQL